MLLFPSFDDAQRRDLAGVSVVCYHLLKNCLPYDVLAQILTYDDRDISNEIKQNILELTLDFNKKKDQCD